MNKITNIPVVRSVLNNLVGEVVQQQERNHIIKELTYYPMANHVLTPINDLVQEPAPYYFDKNTPDIDVDHPIKYPEFTEKEYGHYQRGVLTGDSFYKSPEEEFFWAFSQTKKCSKCHEEKKLTEYNTNTSGSHGFDKNKIRLRRPECKDCTKKASKGKGQAVKHAKSLGISHKAPKDTKCELCCSTKDIVFDHDHNKNSFRGWLCDPCNRSIGVLGDNPQSLLNCVAYLAKHNTEALNLIEKVKNTL
jgi:hypothetical protein